MAQDSNTHLPACRDSGMARKSVAVASMALAIWSAWLAAAHCWSLRSAEDFCRVSDGEAKFAVFKPYLNGINIVGYLTTRHPGQSDRDEMLHSEARYTLAPVLLSTHPNQTIVITNFDSDGELNDVLQTGKFKLVAKIGPGMAVLRRIDL